MASPTKSSWAEASKVKQLDSHTYQVILRDDWCIGSVPHGGYVASCFLAVASAHLSTTLRAQRQPHTMALHLEFPRRTETGPATFAVKDVKLGRQTSTLHITLSQHGRDEVLGYLTQADLDAEAGVTFPTGWALEPPPRVMRDGRALGRGADALWVEQTDMPFARFRRASGQLRFFFPRGGQLAKSVIDQWVCFADGTRFTAETLGFVADMFPQLVEAYGEDEDPYSVRAGPPVPAERRGAKFWYPTVVLNLDVKKALPREGVEWLFCRIRAKQIKKGRLDLEVVVMDEGGELVALSHHVALVLSAGRNLAARRREGEESKM